MGGKQRPSHDKVKLLSEYYLIYAAVDVFHIYCIMGQMKQTKYTLVSFSAL